MTAHADNHVEAEAGRCLWVGGQRGLRSEFQVSRGYISETQPLKCMCVFVYIYKTLNSKK